MTDWFPVPWPVSASATIRLDAAFDGSGWIPVEALTDVPPLTLSPAEGARWQRFRVTSRPSNTKPSDRE